MKGGDILRKIKKPLVIAVCVILVVFSYILCVLEEKGTLRTGLKFRDVVPYQCWLTGIVVFCLILPTKVGTVFDD